MFKLKPKSLLIDTVIVLLLFTVAIKMADVKNLKQQLTRCKKAHQKAIIESIYQKKQAKMWRSWVEGIDPKFATREFSVEQDGSILYFYFGAQEFMRNGMLTWIANHYKISDTLQVEIVDECIKYRNSIVLLAIAAQESSLRPSVVSKKGAIGLCQIMPLWVPELKAAGIIKKKSDLFKISYNVAAASYILEKYINQSHKVIEKALYKYAGTRDGKYVKNIMAKVGSIICELHQTY